MEPFAEVVRNSTGLQGYKRKGGEERIALYTDDVLLFLGDMGPSLVRAMQLLEGFRRISGLIVNWEKSTLLPIDSTTGSLPQGIPRLRVVDKLKYLGIVLDNNPSHYIRDNLAPLLEKFKRKTDVWSRLPLSVAGRVNLVKMIWMPQLMYILHNSPVWIGRDWFVKINSLFRELIWRKGQARISLQTLQRPTREGGLAVPHPYRYLLVAQLQHLGGWV